MFEVTQAPSFTDEYICLFKWCEYTNWLKHKRAQSVLVWQRPRPYLSLVTSSVPSMNLSMNPKYWQRVFSNSSWPHISILNCDLRAFFHFSIVFLRKCNSTMCSYADHFLFITMTSLPCFFKLRYHVTYVIVLYNPKKGLIYTIRNVSISSWMIKY